MIAVVIAVPIMIVMTSFAGLFELMAPLFGLAAVFAVLPFSISQVLFGFFYLPSAFVVTVSRLRWNGAAEEQGANQHY